MSASHSSQREQILDLHQVIAIAWRRKVPILVLAVVVAVAVYALSFLMPRMYEATALVVLTKPVMTGSVASDVRMLSEIPTHRGINAVATAPAVLRQVKRIGVERGLLPADITVTTLASRCSAQPRAKSLLALTATHKDPEAAAALSNIWAEVVAERFNTIYGVGEPELEQLKQRLEQALEKWRKAEQKLLKILPQTHVAVRMDRLDQARQALQTRLMKVDKIDLLIGEAKAVRRRLKLVEDAQQPLKLGSMISVIGLLNTSGKTLKRLSIELSGDIAADDAYTLGEARRTLKRLVRTLKKQQTQLKEEIDRLEDVINKRNVALEKAMHRKAVATERRNLAREAYQTLANQIAQVRVSMSESTRMARVASAAIPPDRPSSPQPVLLAFAGGVVTLLLATLVAVAIPLRADEEEIPDPARRPDGSTSEQTDGRAVSPAPPASTATTTRRDESHT